AAGMDDYLAKPIDPAVLDATLTRWTSGFARAAPTTATADRVTEGVEARLDELRELDPTGELTSRLVESFLDRAPAYLRAMADAVERHDAGAVATQAHGLTGAAGNMGAVAMAMLCRELETNARAGDLVAAR